MIALGLRANRHQFGLLVLVNAFVGAMVGVERATLPLLAASRFGVVSVAAMLSFLVAFGLAKAVANFLAGHLAEGWGRKRVLVTGWVLALPVPLLIAVGGSWRWIVAANLLLGVNQGLAWSATVIMKVDLVGPRQRGLALGLNEFAGYVAAALSAAAGGYLVGTTGPRLAVVWVGAVVAVLGLVVSVVAVRDTGAHAALEHALAGGAEPSTPPPHPRSPLAALARASWGDRRLLAANQAGLVNNLNDGLAWGVFPLYFAAAGLSAREIGWLAAIYPAVWGVAQIAAGAASDRVGRRQLIVTGMVAQGAALALTAMTTGFAAWAWSAVLLGLGTAAVYPTLIAQVSDVVPVRERARTIGVYRLWRDLGYVVGALVAGAAADRVGVRAAIFLVAGLTAASGVFAGGLLRPAAPGPAPTPDPAPRARQRGNSAMG